jgi:flagellar basal-body rod protein FlgC
MSMFKIFDIAATGMSAQSLRLNLVASNMANVDSVGSTNENTYRARHPVFSAMLDQLNPNGAAVGVEMRGVVENQAPLKREYSPEHPKADQDGFIYRPNVDLAEEMADMISASRTYQSNVEVVNTAKQLMIATLRLGE